VPGLAHDGVCVRAGPEGLGDETRAQRMSPSRCVWAGVNPAWAARRLIIRFTACPVIAGSPMPPERCTFGNNARVGSAGSGAEWCGNSAAPTFPRPAAPALPLRTQRYLAPLEAGDDTRAFSHRGRRTSATGRGEPNNSISEPFTATNTGLVLQGVRPVIRR
jgi:hypothetical protein